MASVVTVARKATSGQTAESVWQKRKTRKSTPSTATVAAVQDTEEIDEAGICGEDNGVDTSEEWVLSVEGNNKPVYAEFLPLDSPCEGHTCP